MSDDYVRVMEDVATEVDRQVELWGDQRTHSMAKWLVILGDEYGEACNATLEHEPHNLYIELVQIAAVAVSTAESLLFQEPGLFRPDNHADDESQL